MRRDSIDGYNDDNLGSNAYSCLTRLGAAKKSITSGKVFCLRTLKITNENSTTAAVVKFYDEAEAASPGAPTGANQRLCVIVGPTNTVVLDFTPGVYFKTGVCATQSGGTVNAYDVHVSGYEE